MKQDSHIAVLGAGSWGTALALLLAGNGYPVRLWGHDADHMAQLQADGENKAFLPGVAFPDTLNAHRDLAETVDGCGQCLLVVPSHAFRDVLKRCKTHLHGQPLAWATKGLDDGRLLHETAEELLGKDTALAVLSGPTFAGEVARGLPGAMTVAATDRAYATQLAEQLSNRHFRAYHSDDIIGVELGGAVKNVLAIAAGVADGLGFGANTRSALITRGLAEMARLGEAMGAQPETFMGLAGMGDLVLTCTDNQSRNRRMGLALGQGKDVESTRAEIGQEVEGILTTREVFRLAQSKNVDMPITEQVYRVLYEGLEARQAVSNLLQRNPRADGI